MTLRPRSIAFIVLVWLLSTLLWLTPGLTRPDGVAYFIYLPSVTFDGDLLFFDEWAQMGLIRHGQLLFKDVTETAHLANHWTVGPALTWAPSFLAAEGVARATGEGGSGFTVWHFTAAAMTSALAGLAVLLMGASIARRWFGERASVAAAIAVWFGSPLAWYSLRHASMSHAISAAVCALVLLLSLRLRDSTTAARLFALGLAIGFACAVRPQNVTVALVPLLVAPLRPMLRGIHFAALGALLAGLPQLVVSQALWGGPLVFVNIGGTAHSWQMFTTFRPLETLFSWWHGLATWTPLLVVAIAAFWLLVRRDRGVGLAATATFAAQLLLLSVLERWFWGGAAFGQRRFDSCTVFFLLGLAALFDRAGSRAARAADYAICAGAVGWTMMLFIAAGNLNLNRFQTPAQLLEAFASAAADPVWLTPFGFAPASMRLSIAMAALLATAVTALLALAAWRWRRYAAGAVAAYLLLMTVVLAWCGMHPKYDELSREILRRHLRGELTSAAVRDATGLLRDEAEYMQRVGRQEDAARALRDAAALGKIEN